jgi:DNA-binding YbaB/EbfC family protein
MFGSLKDLAGLAGMMKDLPRMQARLAEVKEHLADLKVSAEGGGGAVRVTANGTLEVESIILAPSLLSAPEEVAHVQELIRGTVNDALALARAAAQQKLTQVAQEMGMPLPPGGLDI